MSEGEAAGADGNGNGTGENAEADDDTGPELEPESGPEVEETSMPAWVGAAARRRGPREKGSRTRVVRAGVVGVVALAGGCLGWRTVTGDGDGRTPGLAVSGFFEAQRTGDCERLIDVLTEASWSQDGRLDRDEFLQQCDDAVVGYRTSVRRVEVEVVDEDGHTSEEGDRAIVRYAGQGDDDELEGTLLREDGEWRVEADAEVLPIGRSTVDTLRGYVAAYNEADCDRMLDYLAEPTWSAGGSLSEDEFLDRCATMMAGAQERRPLRVADVGADRPEGDSGDRVTADALLRRRGERGFDQIEPESMAYVREGLTWKLAGFATASGELVEAASPVPVFEVLELQDRLLDEIRLPEEDCSFFTDTAATGAASDHPARSIRRSFEGCGLGVGVSLHRFDDDVEADESTEDMIAALLADLPPTAEELGEVEGSTTDPADLERYAASYRPNHEAPVPGIADARGVQTSCSVDGCRGASVFAVRDGVLVRIDVQYGDPDMADAAATLLAQMERL